MILGDPIVHYPFSYNLQFGKFTWPFTGFGLAVFLSFLIAQVISERVLRARGYEKESIAVGDVLLAAIVGTLIGAKLYYVGIVDKGGWSQLLSRGGFVYYGGLMGAVAACWITIRFKKLSFARFADVAGIAIAAGYAVGRTGCWAVGDDYGFIYDGPLAVAFPQGAPASTAGNLVAAFGAKDIPPGTDPMAVLSVFPSQLVEVALGFVMFFIAWRLRHHRHAEGWLMGVYLVAAGVERFAVEFLRIKDDRFWGTWFSAAQLLSIVAIIIGIAVLKLRSKPDTPVMPTPEPTLETAPRVA
jgi:phosphatidylglycerol:prolipoprotein diacylglycerol transferase